MSKAGADWVMTLVEMRSAPVDGVGGAMVSSVTPPDTSTSARPATRATHFATSSGVMLSSITRSAPAVDRLDHLLDPVALDFDAAARPLLAAPRRDGLADAEPPEVVVLHEHHLGQRAAVVHAAAGAHGRLLERAQPGQRLAGVPDACATARRVGRGVDEAAGDGRDPERWQRKLSAVRSAVRTEASGPSTVPRTSPGATRSPSADPSTARRPASTWRKVSVAHAVPASTPCSRATNDAPTRARRGRAARR